MNWLKDFHYRFLLWALEHRWMSKQTWKTFKKLQADRFIREVSLVK